MNRLKKWYRELRLPDTWRSIEPIDVLLMRGDADCRYGFRGKWYSTLVDSVADYMEVNGMSSAVVANVGSTVDPATCFRTPYMLNRAYAAVTLRYLARRMLSLVPGGGGWAIEHRIRLWETLLERARPRSVIGIQPSTEVFAACARRSIPCFDLQHGVITPGDPYYEHLRMSARQYGYPVSVLCWDAESAELVDRYFGSRGGGAIVVGNPWTSRFAERCPSDALVVDALSSTPPDSQRPVVLVSLQYGETVSAELPKAVERVIRRTSDRYLWWIRRHPFMANSPDGARETDYLSRTFGGVAGVDWDAPSNMPLPLVLERVSAHLTDSSAVTIEAAAYGIRTGVWNPGFATGSRLSEWFPREVQAGQVSAIPSDADGIERWLDEHMSEPLMGRQARMGTGNRILELVRQARRSCS